MSSAAEKVEAGGQPLASHEPASASSPRPRRISRSLVLVVTAYVLLAMVANLPAWLHGVTHQMQVGGAGDLDEEAWFLGLTPYLVFHAHNPFFTTLLNYPYGTNLVVNTTMFLPGLLLSPVTLSAGPVAAFNVLMVVGFAGSATAAYCVFQRWAPWKPAAFAGGLVYGYSPYMFGPGFGHLFLLLVLLPPVFLLVLDEVIVRQRGNPLRWGALLGLLVAMQFLTSSEVLAGIGVMSAIGTALLAIVRWRVVMDHLRHVIVALAGALVTFLVLCGYPLWMLAFGPQHIAGPAQPVSVTAPLSTDVLGLVAPTANQALSPVSLQHIGNSFVSGSLGENGSYLGIPLVLILVAMVILYRSRPIVRFAGSMALVALIMSLGSRLRVDGHNTGIHLPFLVLSHLPLLNSSIPVRYSLYVFLFAGLILAVGLDQAHGSLEARWSPLLAGAGCLVLAGAAVVPLAPRWPYPIWDTHVPTFYATSAVESVPPGTALLPYPFPRGPEHNEAMLWQALADFRFSLPGGYVITPGPGRVATFSGSSSSTEVLLEDAYTGQPLPDLTADLRCRVVNDLRVWKTATIVVSRRGADPPAATRLFQSVLGAAPRHVASSEVFTSVRSAAERTAGAIGCVPTQVLP